MTRPRFLDFARRYSDARRRIAELEGHVSRLESEIRVLNSTVTALSMPDPAVAHVPQNLEDALVRIFATTQRHEAAA